MSRGRTKSDRSRRCLLLAGLVFLAVQLGVGLILDRSLPKIRFLDAEQVMNAAAGLSRSPDIVFMGSSRFRGGLNMGELQEFMSTSFGVDCAAHVQRGLACRRPLRDGLPDPASGQARHYAGNGDNRSQSGNRKAGVPLDGFSDYPADHLAGHAGCPAGFHRVQAYLTLAVVAHHPRFPVSQGTVDLDFGSPPPYLKAASAAAPPMDRPAAPDVHKDSTPEPAEDSIKSQPVPPDIAKLFRNYQIGGINAQHLESMLTYLHQRNVPVILVGVPACRYYLDCYTPEINRKFMDYIEYLRCAYGCSFVDCRNRVPNKFFKDDVHLSPAGAVLFTRMLESEVLHDAWMNFRRSQKNEYSGVE